MSDLQHAIDGLHRLCADVRQISSMAEEMLTWLTTALVEVRQFDGARARSAEAEIRIAVNALREARGVWLDDYVRRSEDLCRRIAS